MWQWFFFVLAAYKLAAVAGMPFRRRLPYLLPLLTLVLHFASYADAPWPLMRNPVNYRPQSNPMAHLEETFRAANWVRSALQMPIGHGDPRTSPHVFY